MLFFADSGEGAASQAMLMGSATTVIVLTLAAINALGNPYRTASGSIKPVAMERSLRILDDARTRRWTTRPSFRATPAAFRSRPDGRRETERLHAPLRAGGDGAAGDGGRGDRLVGLPGGALARRAGARRQSGSIAARVESTRAENLANRQGQIDVALFTQWVDAYARDETELADFYRRRFREEFKPAFNAWVATKPRTNPSAPLSPFAMPQYKLAANAEADRLEAKAAAFSVRVGCLHPARGQLLARGRAVRGRRCSSRASAPACTGRRRAWSCSGSATLLFFGTVIWIATLPVSVSV